MKNKVQVTITAGILGILFSIHAQAQDDTASEKTHPASSSDNDSQLYHPLEFSVDGFAAASLSEHYFHDGNLTRKDFHFAAGAGANFFFTQYVGVGADAYTLTGHTSTFVDTTTGNLILRIPIGNTGLAPYIFGGAGYQFNGVDQIVGGGGVGLEMRIVPHFSIFGDARYLAAAKTDGFGLARAGVRLSF
jgi:hypothetical protein